MATNNDQYDDIPSMVPERDEIVANRKSKRGAGSAPVDYTDTVVSSRTSGGVRFLLTILFLGLIASGGAGYYFYDQSMQMQESLLTAQGNIRQLQNRLNLVDESAEQSSMGLLEKVDANFTQIDLLWANYRNHTASLTELKNVTEATDKSLTTIEQALGVQASSLNENINLVKNMQTRLETISNNIAGMDNLDQQLNDIQGDISGLKTTMDGLQSNMAGRISTTEQDIESINIHRLQITQTLNTIQSKINGLEQRLGP